MRGVPTVLSALSVANAVPHPFVAYLSVSDRLAVDSVLVVDTQFVTALTVYMIHRFDEESEQDGGLGGRDQFQMLPTKPTTRHGLLHLLRTV
jgi:hypothetical protein